MDIFYHIWSLVNNYIDVPFQSQSLVDVIYISIHNTFDSVVDLKRMCSIDDCRKLQTNLVGPQFCPYDIFFKSLVHLLL